MEVSPPSKSEKESSDPLSADSAKDSTKVEALKSEEDVETKKEDKKFIAESDSKNPDGKKAADAISQDLTMPPAAPSSKTTSTEATPKVDSEGKRLQIDDLIILPSNLSTGTGPEGAGGGSALQNLAKIASRYQNKPGAVVAPGTEANGSSQAKRARMDGSGGPDSIAATQPIPASASMKPTTSLAASSSPSSAVPSSAASAAAASSAAVLAAAAAAASGNPNIFSLLPPGILPNWPNPGGTPPTTTATSSASSSPSSAAKASSATAIPGLAGLPGLPAGFPLGDASALGPEGFNFLQYYEKQVREAAQAQARKAVAASGPASAGSKTASVPFNGKDSSSSSSPLPAVSGATNLKDNGNTAKEKEKESFSSSSGSSAVAAKLKKEISEKDRSKVCKPPPDNKRPPSLMQTPCAFVQTSRIYTNPMAEINKLRGESTNSSIYVPKPPPKQASAGTLDLSGIRKMPGTSGASSGGFSKSDPDPIAALAARQAGMAGIMNLKTDAAALSSHHQHAALLQQHMDLSYKKEVAAAAATAAKPEFKASPFSAESLLSKPAAKPAPPPKHDLVKVAPISALTQPRSSQSSFMESAADALRKQQQQQQQDHLRASPHMSRASPAGSLYSSHSPAASDHKSRASPWHTPVSSLHSPSATDFHLQQLQQQHHQHRKEPSSSSKPAIPVSPVVREDKRSSQQHQQLSVSSASNHLLDSHLALAGLLPPSSTVSTASILAASNALSLSTMSHPSLSSSVASQVSNPYLALMASSAAAAAKAPPPPSAAPPPAAPPAIPGFPSHLMDPATSAYYAALYSQQMYGAAGMSPYGMAAASAAAGLRPPGAGAASSAPPPPPPPSAAASLEAMQASALQAMLARSGLGGLPSASGAAAPNPYAAYPGLGAGLPGYPGFPPQRKD